MPHRPHGSWKRADEIIAANNIDIENAKKNGTRQAMIDRLTLTKERIDGIAEGVRPVSYTHLAD